MEKSAGLYASLCQKSVIFEHLSAAYIQWLVIGLGKVSAFSAKTVVLS